MKTVEQLKAIKLNTHAIYNLIWEMSRSADPEDQALAENLDDQLGILISTVCDEIVDRQKRV